MGKYIGKFATDTEIQNAVTSGALQKPFVAYDSINIHYNDKEIRIPYTGSALVTKASGVSWPQYVISTWDENTGEGQILLNAPITTIPSKAFRNNNYLLTIDLSKHPITVIDSYAFQRAPLSSITLPSTLIKIETGVFGQCYYLTSITLPEGLQILDSGCFSQSGLTTITIPSTVTKINTNAFKENMSLTDFNYAGTMEQWGSINLVSGWNIGSPFTVVHCSDGDVTL